MNCAKTAVAVLILFLTACNSATPSAPTSTASASPLATHTTAPSATPTIATIPTQIPTTTPTATPVPTFTLTGIAFFDYNGNGVRDGNEPVIPNAKVRVGDLTTTTSADGNYSLAGVPKGKPEITISAEGFHFVSLSLQAFQTLDRPVPFTIDGDTKRDWGLMVGFLTFPFKCEDTWKLRTTPGYVDLDYRLGFIRTYAKSCPPDPVDSCSTRDNHEGIDWPGPEGTPIVAMAPGTVIDVGEIPTGAYGGGGKFVHVLHDALGRKFATDYAHNSQNLVTPGQKVDRGQVIALLGKTGSDIPHLHWNFFEVPLSVNTRQQYNGYVNSLRKIPDPLHQYDVAPVLDPFRDLSNPASVSLWTKDNSPECIQSSSVIPASTPDADSAINPDADSAINPDGNPNDWGNRKPNLTSPSNNAARVAGADISAVYAIADSKNLYLRLDQYGGFPLPPLRPFQYEFDLTSPEWGKRYYQINIPNSGSPLYLLPIEGATLLFKEQKVYDAVAIGQVLEAIVPLEVLKNPSQIMITVFAHADREMIKWFGSVTVQLKR